MQNKHIHVYTANQNMITTTVEITHPVLEVDPVFSLEGGGGAKDYVRPRTKALQALWVLMLSRDI